MKKNIGLALSSLQEQKQTIGNNLDDQQKNLVLSSLQEEEQEQTAGENCDDQRKTVEEIYDFFLR
jgi:hypothetical protein